LFLNEDELTAEKYGFPNVHSIGTEAWHMRVEGKRFSAFLMLAGHAWEPRLPAGLTMDRVHPARDAKPIRYGRPTACPSFFHPIPSPARAFGPTQDWAGIGTGPSAREG